MIFLSFFFFLRIPQSFRSLSENNFTIFSDISIENGINKLRGQGVESGWPHLLEKVLFNKSEFLTLGFLNWMSNLNPSIYFGQFDSSGRLNFVQAGLLTKVLIVPFLFGLIYLISRGEKKQKALLLFFLIFTFPSFFTLHGVNHKLVALTIPTMAFVTGFGLLNLNKKASVIIIFIMLLELLLLISSISLERKNTNNTRPNWVSSITNDAFALSAGDKVAVSDNIVEDVVEFISWNNPIDIKTGFLDVPSPYRFRQTKIGNINLIGSDNEFYNCGLDKPTYIIASNRDIKKIRGWLNIKDDKIIEKVYLDNLENKIAYLLRPIVCIKGF